MSVQFAIEAIDGDALVAAGHPVEPPAMVPNPVNLVRASRIPADNTSGRWVNGFSFVPDGIGEIGLDDSCSGEHVDYDTIDPFTSDWMPYILSAKYQCSTFGSASINDYVGRAQRLLEAATPKLLETEFWGGPLSQAASLDNPYLANFTGTALTASNIQAGLGVLEDALGDCAYGGRGMIHCPPYAVSFMGSDVRREGNLLLTLRDTIVVPGSGYASFHTGGGTFDMYATGLTDVRMGEIIVHDPVSMDRSQNLVTIRAYRYACASWDELCHAKVTVTLP